MDRPPHPHIRLSPPPILAPIPRARTARMHPRSVQVHFISTRAPQTAPTVGSSTGLKGAVPESTLAGVGEDTLIADLLAQLPAGTTTDKEGTVLVGPEAGDDCAILRAPGQPDRWRLMKTDCVIEGVHFTLRTEPERVGWKALCRAVSDFAAMGGGEPEHALITLALRRETPLAYARGLYVGLGRAAVAFGVRIVGGETASTPGSGFLSVALSGTIPRRRCVRRAGGRVGDAVFVTGRLGGSLASGRHLDFIPRLPEARWLSTQFPIHAMMDLSDGLGADLPRLAHLSGVSFRVERDRLPLSPGCDADAAVNDGEDYELLFTVAARHIAGLEEAWRRQFPNVLLTRIGELIAASDSDDGGATGAAGGGFDHFR